MNAPARRLLPALLGTALVLGACAAPVRPRAIATLPGGGAGDASAFLDGARAAGLDVHLVSTGRTTGRVFDVEVRNDGESRSTWQWSGWLAVLSPPGTHAQRMLASGSWRLDLEPGAIRRLPLRGFCLDPGVLPLAAGTRSPARDVLRPGRVRPLPIAEERVATSEGMLPVLRVSDAITREQLGAGAGRLFLLTLAGIERVEAEADAWTPASEHRGMVQVQDATGRRLHTLVLADPDADAIPEAGRSTADGVVALDPTEDVEIRVAKAIAARAPSATAAADVEDVEAPATTVAQHAIWRAAEAWRPDEERAAPPPALPPTARRAAEAVLDEAEREVRDDLGVDFSLFDLTRKPAR